MTVGRYKGYNYKKQRICDVLCVQTKARWWFLYIGYWATGDHFRTLRELKQYVDGLPAKDPGMSEDSFASIIGHARISFADNCWIVLRDGWVQCEFDELDDAVQYVCDTAQKNGWRTGARLIGSRRALSLEQ